MLLCIVLHYIIGVATIEAAIEATVSVNITSWPWMYMSTGEHVLASSMISISQEPALVVCVCIWQSQRVGQPVPTVHTHVRQPSLSMHTERASVKL